MNTHRIVVALSASLTLVACGAGDDPSEIVTVTETETATAAAAEDPSTEESTTDEPSDEESTTAAEESSEASAAEEPSEAGEVEAADGIAPPPSGDPTQTFEQINSGGFVPVSWTLDVTLDDGTEIDDDTTREDVPPGGDGSCIYDTENDGSKSLSYQFVQGYEGEPETWPSPRWTVGVDQFVDPEGKVLETRASIQLYENPDDPFQSGRRGHAISVPGTGETQGITDLTAWSDGQGVTIDTEFYEDFGDGPLVATVSGYLTCVPE